MIFGHDAVRMSLELHLPHVTMLIGPPSVGKRALALHLADHHGVHPADRRILDELSTEAARDLRRFTGVTPMGRLKLVILNVDGAQDSALNALLKLLEEPPPTCKFIILASRRTLDTIASRSEIHQLGLLSEEAVRAVLIHRTGMSEEAAEDAARLSGGTVAGALSAGDYDAARASVLTVLKAVADKDSELLEKAASQWDEQCHSLLLRWCVEARTGRWRVFTSAETFGLADGPVPGQVLLRLRTMARPRLALRSQLAPLCRQA